MKTLLTTEWLKLKKYRTFWILLGFFALLLPLWNYGIANGVMKFGSGDINVLNKAYTFSFVWQNLGFWTSIFVVFIAILIIIITTNEYQFKTNRQNIIDGWKRLDFYHAKWMMVLLLSLLTTLYVFIVGVALAANQGSMSSFPGEIQFLFYVLLLSLNYYGFALLLSLFFKRSGITIGIFFLYSMIIESLLGHFINWQSGTEVGNFLPLQCSDELLPFPMLDMMKTMMNITESSNTNYYIIASVGWIIAYYFIGRQKLLRSDW